MPLQLCPKCSRMHFLTDKCQVAQKSPGTAHKMVGGFPVPAAPFSRGGTGGPDQADNMIDMDAGGQGVTGGESAVTVHPKPKRKDTRKRQGDRHKPGYYPEYRQRKKASQPHQTETEK